MPCPICDHTMQNLGTGDLRRFWCPRCGTLMTVDENSIREEFEAPKLVKYVREGDMGAQPPGKVHYSITGYVVPAASWRAAVEAVGFKPIGS